MVSVGGSTPFPVLLDTGSSGLRVYAAALTTFHGVAGVTTTHDQYSYGSGNTYYGYVAQADAKLYGVTPGGSVDFGSILYEDVTSICATGTPPPCGSSGVTTAEASGKYGILGVRPIERNDSSGEVYSPISYLPGNLGRGFIVSLGNATNEQLILGLTPGNSSGFNTDTVGSTLGADGRYNFNNDTTFPFCYTFVSADATTSFTSPCGTYDFLSDTGRTTANLQFSTKPTGPESLVDASGNLKAGTTITASLNGATWWTLTAGECTSYNQVSAGFGVSSPGPETNGVLPYYYEDVLYDLVDGIFGYRNAGTSTPPFCSGPQDAARRGAPYRR
jgi:hypothetical protein